MSLGVFHTDLKRTIWFKQVYQMHPNENDTLSLGGKNFNTLLCYFLTGL